MKSKSARGYTLIELMMVITILGVMGSIVSPRMQLLLERAYQGKAKGELGALRSALSLYYSDTEGFTPFRGEPDGVASARGLALSQVLAPVYIQKIPTPYLADFFFWPPTMKWDVNVKIQMAQPLPEDIIFISGPQQAVLASRPYVYDPQDGKVYYCNGNNDVSGKPFYSY